MSAKHDFVGKQEKLCDFKPDQTVIIKQKYLRYLPGIQYEDDVPDQPDAEDWYPLVNSYYPFTEDVDAFARVNHLLETREDSGTSKGSTDYEYKDNVYSERAAQQQYLRTKPICFLVLGKPGLGEEAVGRRLANYWKCVYIDPQILLEEEIANESRAGQCIEFNLRCGRSIGIDVILRLLAKKLQSSSVLHRGFVLCGFPLVPNDLYAEDPISSESAVFNVQEIFEEIFDTTIALVDTSAKVEVSMSGSPKPPSENTDKLPADEQSDVDDVEIKMSFMSYENEICGPSDISTDLEKQMNLLFGFFRDPFFIIYIYCKNSDVVSIRDNYFFDIYSKKTVDMQKIKLFYEYGATNELLVEDIFDAGSNPFAVNPNLRHLVKVPENLPANVNTQLNRYHNTIANTLDCRILLHDNQYYIKLDGRSFISQMMDLIKLRLKVLPLQKVILPQRFNVTLEAGGEGMEPADTAELTPEEAFLNLSKHQVVAPVFKWVWSDWGVLCPVSMSDGSYTKGSSKYAVHFMNKIFFLADESAFVKFYENPRRYLMPPFPKPGAKILIFGPPLSGKTAVARCLGYLLNSKILTPHEVHEDYLNQLISEHKEKVKQAAIAEALELLKKLKNTEFNEKKNQRKQEIEEWETSCIELLTELNMKFGSQSKKSVSILSSFPIRMEYEVGEDDVNEEGDVIRTKLLALNLPFVNNRNLCQQLLKDRDFLRSYLPEYLKKEIVLESATVLDPFVLDYANEQVENVGLDDIMKEAEESLFEMFVRAIRVVEEQGDYDGWVIDGMITDISLLRQIFEDFSIDEIIILFSSPDNQSLLQRFQDHNKHLNQFRNFRSFFLAIGEKDAAWRAPSTASTESYKKQVAKDILSDILNFDADEEEISTEKQLSLQQYDKDLNVYDEKMKHVQDFFDTAAINTVKINILNLPIEELLAEVIGTLRNKYRRLASEFTETDRAEEVRVFFAQPVQAGEGETGDQGTDDNFAKNRRYGDTYYYCPVTFFENFVLWRGKEQYAAKFKDKVYLMATENDMENFIKQPRKYLLRLKPPNTFPPPRVCVVGVRGCGKTTISKSLARNMGVRYLDYETIRRAAINKLSGISLLVKASDDDTQEIPDVLIYAWLEMLYSYVWFEEPLKYSGFVLDNFPQKPHDITSMVQHKAIPDIVICVSVSRDEIFRRSLEKTMQTWREEQHENSKAEAVINSIIHQEWEKNRKARYDELMELKRDNRYSSKISQEIEITESEPIPEEFDEAGLKSDTQISFDSVVEQRDHEETLKILDEEFPEPVFDEHLESEEEAMARFVSKIESDYVDSAVYLDEVKQICERELIPWYDIDGNLELDRTVAHAYIATDEIKFRNRSLFERCYDVSLEIAEKLLVNGYYFLSFFGKTCPVQYYEGYNPLQIYLASEQRNKIFPVIHREYIYFIDGKESHKKFTKDPLKYTNPKNFMFPLIPVRVAVIGPPKCGKSTLANRFIRDLGFRLVTRGQAARYTLQNKLFSNLIIPMEHVLRKGDELTDEMTMDCVQVASFCGESVTQGLIFDGFPNSISEINFLSRLGLVPHLIFDLQATEDTVYQLAVNPSDKTPLYSQRFIRHIFEEWKKTEAEFRIWCDREYQNIYKLPVDRSIWGVWDHAKDVTFAVSFERKHYYKHADMDWPLRVANMLVTPLEFLERQSSYKTYCPVCFYHSHALTNCGEPPDRTGLVHFRKYFYWICDNHIEEFLKMPEKFIPPSNRCLPQELPHILHLNELPENPVENGYCVVCYQSNLPAKVLNKGIVNYSVTYKNRIYLFESNICLNLFMATPKRWCTITINFKQDDNYPSLDYRDLPVLGMLEQYVARTIVRAVSHVNVNRPIIPGLSISAAALICIGLNLKIHNSNTPKKYLPLYKTALATFHERRLNLIKYLDLMKKYLNPFVHYEEPELSSSSEDKDSDDDDDDACQRSHILSRYDSKVTFMST